MNNRNLSKLVATENHAMNMEKSEYLMLQSTVNYVLLTVPYSKHHALLHVEATAVYPKYLMLQKSFRYMKP